MTEPLVLVNTDAGITTVTLTLGQTVTVMIDGWFPTSQGNYSLQITAL